MMLWLNAKLYWQETTIYKTNKDSIITKWNHDLGLSCFCKTDHPEMCLLMDEVSSDLSQKGDVHISGAKCTCGRGTNSEIKGHHIDKHFTLLDFVALIGDPLPCLVILASVQDTLIVEASIDPFFTQTCMSYFVEENGKSVPATGWSLVTI